MRWRHSDPEQPPGGGRDRQFEFGFLHDDERSIRRLSVTRRTLFEELDRLNIRPQPAQPYCFANGVCAGLASTTVSSSRVILQCSSSLHRHGSRGELTPHAVAIFPTDEQVAANMLGRLDHRAHLPQGRFYQPDTAGLRELILDCRPDPERGIVRPVRRFGANRLEAADGWTIRCSLDYSLIAQIGNGHPPMVCRSSTSISANLVPRQDLAVRHSL